MRWLKPKFLAAPLGAAIACAAAIVGGGCAPVGHQATRPAEGSAFTGTSAATLAAARVEAMSAADAYSGMFVQAVDEMRSRTQRQEVVAWALEQRVTTASAVYANATHPNDFVALLDMMVFVTLKRYSLEEHWVPNVLRDEGKGVLDAARRGERYVWKLGSKVLTEPQCDELSELIEAWRRAHPGQYYVAHIRFTDFAAAMSVAPASGLARGSLLGMLYIDPLAGLDPVARELQQYRALSERMVYLVNRAPVVVAWQVDLAVHRTTNGPQVVSLVGAAQAIGNAALQLSETTARFAHELTAERTAAVAQLEAATDRQVNAAVGALDAAVGKQVKSTLDQTFAGLTTQREGIVKDIAGEEARARAIVGDLRGVVDRAADAGRTLNASTAQTIDEAERSARRTLNHAAALAVGLVAAMLLLLLGYRIAVRRWASQREPARQVRTS